MSAVHAPAVSANTNWKRFADDPLALAECSITELYSLSDEQRQTIQLEGARRRFAELRDKVPVLGNLAADQGVERIDKIEDVGPLLFSHAVYKSYPLSLIERNNFVGLTRWLSGLTSYDLSKIDAKACQSIEEWLDLIDAQTPLRPLTTSGTSGKMSFVPRAESEWRTAVKGYFLWRHQGFRDEPLSDLSLDDVARLPLLYLNYRHGRHTTQRTVDTLVATLRNGDESGIRALYPGRMSVDVLSLAGRIRAAEAKGTLSSLKISPALLAQREQFTADRDNMAGAVQAYFTDIVREYRDARVMLFGTWGQLFDGAIHAREMGLRQLFRPDSLVTCGGGFKGRVLPDGWYEIILDFLGVPAPRGGYGCSEQITSFQSCAHGRYHILPMVAPFLLDPDTGAQLPRTGTHTGRFAFLDLMAHTYWGGFVTGDEVTITWDKPCECGRSGPYVHPQIQRYSEKRGGDDKITCAGMPAAHESALDFIARSTGEQS